MPKRSAATAIYAYCLVRSVGRPSTARVPPGLPGAERPSPHALDRDLWLIAAPVPLDTYGPGALEASLKDIDWVSGVALAHEGVVEHFARARGATVIPLKLFTMFSTIERALDEMGMRAVDLRKVFRRIEGCEEWGVRVLRGAAVRRPRPEPMTTRSGAAFLAARKKERESSRAAAAAAADAAERAFASLLRIARDGRRQTPATDLAAAPLLDAAFLVPARHRARFHAAAERLARDVNENGGRMTLSGPWPPYNFVAGGAS
jgi:hypothetical protein